VAGNFWSYVFDGHSRPQKFRWPATARLLAIALILPSAAVCGTTGPGRIELFGHEIVVRSFVKHQGEAIWETDVLTIDKKVLLRDRQIHIWDSGSFEGLGFAVGMHTSGAMCDNHFFVLVFPDNAPPRIEGTFAACWVRYAIEKDHVIFETENGDPGVQDQDLRSRWIWTRRGLGAQQRFKIKTGVVGKLLQSRSIQQPSDLLEHAEFTGQIAQLAKDSHFAEDVLFGIIKGPGTVRYEGNVLLGKACQAGDCSLGSLLVAVDLATNRLYLALKRGDKSAIIAPEQTTWPSTAQNELGEWTSQSDGK
jgi:hypothetical protein